MRFLMVTTFYPPYNFGGDGMYIHRLSHELARRGHEVEVVHCTDAYHLLRPSGPAMAPSDEGPVRVHRLRSGRGLLSPLWTQQTGRAGFKQARLKPLIEQGRFDVVHYHNMSLIGLDALTWGHGMVKLYTTHEHWIVCPMHVLWRNNQEACTKQTCFTCQLRSGRPPQWWRYTPLAERSLAHVDRFLCPSRFTLAKHQGLGFHGPMTHLPYFLPRSEAEEEAPPGPSPHPRPYALFVGRLEKIKGAQNLVRTFRHYRGCDLVLIGDGEYGRELRGLADGLAHVHFTGRLDSRALRAWYRHALAVVVPSVCYEVFGIIVLEAHSVRTPALVTPYGALPEVVEEGGGGLVYHSDAELTSMLDRLQADPDHRDALGARGYDAWQRLWSDEPHIDQYLTIVAEAAGRTRD